MTLTGLLSDYPLPELLVDLGARQRSGWLRVRGDALDIDVTLVCGNVVAAASLAGGKRLGSWLLASGCVTRAQLDDILATQGDTATGTSTGELLVRSGYAREADVRGALTSQVEDLFDLLLAQRRGRFTFRRGLASSRAVHIAVPLQQATFAAMSRVDERSAPRHEAGRVRLPARAATDVVDSASGIDYWPLLDVSLDLATEFSHNAGAGWPDDQPVVAGSGRRASGAERRERLA